MNFVSANIKQLMDLNNMNMSEFARASGIDKSTISRWFSSEVVPRQDAVAKIARAFNLPLDYFYDESFSMYWKKEGDEWVEKYPMSPIYEASAGDGRINEEYASEYQYKNAELDDDSWCVVCGDSMYPEIHDGDKVRIKHTMETTKTDLTMVKVDGESCTIKYVEITETGVWLRALNKEVFEDRFFTVAEVMTLPVKIIGKVVEIRRTY